MAPVRAMLHECDGSHLQFVFWQALIRFVHSVDRAQRASACGGGSLETGLSFEEEFSQYGKRQDSDRTLTDSEETYCSELDTADSQNKVFMDLSHSRPVIKFDMFSIFARHLHSLTQLERTEILQTLTNISIYNAYCARANFL